MNASFIDFQFNQIASRRRMVSRGAAQGGSGKTAHEGRRLSGEGDHEERRVSDCLVCRMGRSQAFHCTNNAGGNATKQFWYNFFLCPPNLKVLLRQGHFRFEGPAFPTVQELILYQYQSGLPVTSRSGAVLRKPILRERWELNNDDVLLLDKIGRVCIYNDICVRERVLLYINK